LRRRISTGSIPSRAAAISINRSVTNAACCMPKARYAPNGTLLVTTASSFALK